MAETQSNKERIGDLLRKPAALVMNRVPKATLSRFHIMCDEEHFCSDRGMLLKYLIDFHDGIIPSGIEHLEMELLALREQIELLKASKQEPSKKEIIRTMLNGRRIEQNGNTK